VPESDGNGCMLSAFVSQEFGFGRPLTCEELMVINTTRFRKQYLDTQTAVEVTMTFYKPSLTHSPFVKYLFIGANEKGYWNSSYGSPV
jgi:hypothetical protein